ncbi:hypothetical protein NQD34_010936 [Periophthalmus magnuspinnatus]|nr:hypothetical protein NQD34_010936 [Periophthalmus magnuspinnatus]
MPSNCKFLSLTAVFILYSCYSRVNSWDVSRIPSIAKYLSTKGRYEEVNPHLLADILSVNTTVIRPPSPQCREIYLAAIIRHGTRYPTTKNVKKMLRFYDTVKKSAAAEDRGWLREIRHEWTMWYREDMDGRLVPKGIEDHRHLAVRLSKLFPKLISEEKLRAGLIKFISSSKHRCINSTLAFKRGLTELWDITDMEFDHTVNDALMRFFDQCTKFVQDVSDNPTALSEVDEFNMGPEMERVQEKVADRLGVPYSHITDESAEAAFYLCAYEFAITNVNSPWCQLFDEVDAQVVLEYANDLKQYWKRAYGYDINSKSSCILFHDVFSRLEKAAEENKHGSPVTEAVTIQIGHAETLLPLLTLLGFFKDTEPLKSENYASQTKRTFRTSHILPYAANLVLVLYDCGEGELRLQPLLNEKTVAFPGLSVQQSSMPLYADVRERYKELLQGCDFETECQLFKQPTEN